MLSSVEYERSFIISGPGQIVRENGVYLNKHINLKFSILLFESYELNC